MWERDSSIQMKLYHSTSIFALHSDGVLTAASYFRKVLRVVTSDPFYSHYVHLPCHDAPVPKEIRHNYRWWPYFQSVLGALDGTHIRCFPAFADIQLMRNRKGGLTQNVLAACGLDLLFHYIVSGWDGSTADNEMFVDARLANFRIPAGRRYLADSGFGICDALLIPYAGVRYHLAEWGRADIRYACHGHRICFPSHSKASPVNAQELYNLRHASARNVVERIFGVLKERFEYVLQLVF
jgi:hypothetical protein